MIMIAFGAGALHFLGPVASTAGADDVGAAAGVLPAP